MEDKKLILGVWSLVFLALLGSTAIWAARQSPQSIRREGIEIGTQGKAKLPIVDLEKKSGAEDQAADAQRLARSRRYDNRRPEAIAELPPGIEELPLNSHWNWGSQALPASQSDAIIRGKVVAAEAHLSADRTSVYSEFKIHIAEVFKDYDAAPVVVGDQLVVEREGGAVRFPSGRIQEYLVAKQQLPIKGLEYLFFLKYNREGQDFSIMTGYELRRGHVVPLDSLEQFANHRGVDQTSFLKEIRRTVKENRLVVLTKGGGPDEISPGQILFDGLVYNPDRCCAAWLFVFHRQS